MAPRLAIARLLSAPDEWNRRKLQILFAAASLVALAVVGGIVWSVVALTGWVMSPTAESEERSRTGTADAGATFMLEDAQPEPLATASTGTIEVPQPQSLGPAQVATGFPRTPEGAMAQLVAIDQRAIQSASLVTAQDVIGAWAAPGGPTTESWSGVAAVRALLESAGLPASGTSDLVVELHPAMGLIEDATGAAVTACVDFLVNAGVLGGQPNRIAAADCQHMVWQGGRWVIAAGPEAEPTASLWPGTQASYDAGYQWLEIVP